MVGGVGGDFSQTATTIALTIGPCWSAYVRYRLLIMAGYDFSHTMMPSSIVQELNITTVTYKCCASHSFPTTSPLIMLRWTTVTAVM